MVSKFIIAAYMSILGTDNVHIWTNKFENLDKCDLHKTRYFDDIFIFQRLKKEKQDDRSGALFGLRIQYDTV